MRHIISALESYDLIEVAVLSSFGSGWIVLHAQLLPGRTRLMKHLHSSYFDTLQNEKHRGISLFKMPDHQIRLIFPRGTKRESTGLGLCWTWKRCESSLLSGGPLGDLRGLYPVRTSNAGLAFAMGS